MSSNTKRQLIDTARSPTPLTEAVGRSERVKTIVEECAGDLSSVNAALTQELLHSAPTTRVATAIEKSEVVEAKVQDAAAELTVVNAALQVEVKERHALEDRLCALAEQSEADRHASLHDALTGLPNRALFNDRLEHGLAQASRHGWIFAVLFLDLDNFKDINDHHGHEAGDGALQIVSDRLRKIARRDDTLCRHGGDEFLFLLTEIRGEKDAVNIAKKVIAAVEQPCEIPTGGTPVSVEVSVSIGIAVWPKHGIDPDELVRQADAAMYEAKRSGSGYSLAGT